MTRPKPLPPDSVTYAELAFREKEALRKKRARMSFKRKLEVLDRLREEAKRLPKPPPGPENP